jgi:hypothetical protein
MRALLVITLGLLLASCEWVKPTSGAESVSLVKAGMADSCQKVGSTHSRVKDGLGIVKRKEQKVTQELVTLAKNEAAKLGGDTIVARGPIVEGEQEFDVYKC